jgi:hypothetical protein
VLERAQRLPGHVAAGDVDRPQQRHLVAVDGGELGGERAADLGAQRLAAVGQNLLEHGRERLLQQRRPPDAGGELVDDDSPDEEGVQSFGEGSLVDERRQGGGQQLRVAARRLDEQGFEVVEVDVDRAQRHARLGGDVARRRAQVAPGVEGQQSVDDRGAGAGSAGQASVGRGPGPGPPGDVARRRACDVCLTHDRAP